MKIFHWEGNNSPEKEIYVIPKIIKKRNKKKMRSRRGFNLRQLTRSTKNSPNRSELGFSNQRQSSKVMEQSAKNSPSKINRVSYQENVKKQSFLEYASEIYSKVLRAQKSKREEEGHNSYMSKSKIKAFSLTRQQKYEFSTNNGKNEE